MKIRPYGNDKWFRIPPKKHPDKLMMDYLTGQNEFSAFAAINFDNHLRRLASDVKNGFLVRRKIA